MQLESRKMLVAGIEFVDGTVFIEGSNENDRSTIEMVDSSTIEVTLSGVGTQQFDVESVDLIRFRGLDGNDRFTNNTDINATAFGNRGNDRLEGGGGHNRFQGGDGDDVLVGGDRNDSLRGRDGNDTILGGRRHDRLFGGDGDDFIRGEHGRDRIRGDAGNDRLVGGNDADNIQGGEGEDILNGNNDNDRLSGGSDNDTIRGGGGDDDLKGDGGVDQLEGGDGNDSLFGGLSTGDNLVGDAGQDRLLLVEGDDASNVDGSDAVIEFVNSGSLLGGGFWSEQHIDIVDQAFETISRRTGGSVGLLQDSTSDSAILFLKSSVDEPGNVVENGVRTITLEDWDVRDETGNRNALTSAIGHVALTWADPADANQGIPGAGEIVNDFRSVSQWGEGADVPDGFVASTDGEWFYIDGTEFVDQRGQSNPFEDWATTWEAALDESLSFGERQRLGDKLVFMNDFFDSV